MSNLRKAFFALAIVLLAASSCQQERYYVATGYAQGGTYKVTYSLSRNLSREIEKRINGALQDIDNSVSGYNEKSLLTAVNAAEAGVRVEVDPIFADIFRSSLEVNILSEGVFDVSAGPVFNLWGFGFTEREKVTPAMRDSVLQFVGMSHFLLEEEKGRWFITKDDSRASLNFNAIAQGWSCDYVAGILDQYGSGNYLVDIGEIACKGLNPRGEKWRVGVDKPVDGNQTPGAEIQEIIEISDCGLVTSGNYRKFFVEDGRKYSHTIDPRTGEPVSHNLLSATVKASDATTADAYATWFMALGLEATKAKLESLPGVEVFLIYDQDGEMQQYDTIN